MSEFISESDFSADDSIQDPDYNPSTSKRKRSLIEEPAVSVKKMCMNPPSYARKIIFRDEFYTEVEKVSIMYLC